MCRKGFAFTLVLRSESFGEVEEVGNGTFLRMA
jgi:hypothetical protein